MLVFEILLAIIILCIIIYLLFLKNVKYFVLYFFDIITIITIILSSIYLESGKFVLELGTNTYSNGSGFSQMFYILLFCLVFSFGLKISLMKKEQNSEFGNNSLISLINTYIIKIIPFFAIISLVYLYVDLYLSGIPLFNNTIPGRMSYFSNVSILPYTSTIYSLNVYYFPLIFGFEYSDAAPLKKKKILIYLIFSIIYLLLINFKVSGPMDVVKSFLAPILVNYVINKKININIFKFFKTFIVIVSIVFAFVFFNYSHNYSGQNIMQKIIDRSFGMTSHLHWATISHLEKTSNINYLENIGNEISGVKEGASVYDPKYGVSKLMVNLADKNISYGYLANNTRMGSTFITVSLFNCGYILTIFIVIAFAFVYAFLIKSLFLSIVSNNILKSLLLYKLTIFYRVFIFNSGSLIDFFNYKNLIVILLILAVNIISKIKRKE